MILQDTKKLFLWIFGLAKSYLGKYTRNELQEILLSLGYSLPTIDDVLMLVEENNMNL